MASHFGHFKTAPLGGSLNYYIQEPHERKRLGQRELEDVPGAHAGETFQPIVELIVEVRVSAEVRDHVLEANWGDVRTSQGVHDRRHEEQPSVVTPVEAGEQIEVGLRKRPLPHQVQGSSAHELSFGIAEQHQRMDLVELVDDVLLKRSPLLVLKLTLLHDAFLLKFHYFPLS